MVETIEELDFSKKISKNELLHVLKKEASRIHVHDLMITSVYLHEESKYMPEEYRKNFVNTFIKGFINRFKELKEDKKEYTGCIENKDLQKFLKTLEEERQIQREELKIKQDHYFFKLAKITEIVAIYTTFILEASVHPIGTLFPGGFELKFENEIYLCPVKEKNLNNPYALCKFCVSKQAKNV